MNGPGQHGPGMPTAGETDALADATDALREAVRDIRPFVLRLQNYGSVKTEGSHTSFLQVSCDNDELNRLYESLESALWERGFSKNRGRLTPPARPKLPLLKFLSNEWKRCRLNALKNCP